MLKKQAALLMILAAFAFGGCFGKNTNSSGDTGNGVTLVRDGERVKIIADDEIAGGSFVINQAIESDNILVEADKMKIVEVKDGKTYVSIVDVDRPSVEGDKLFELKNISGKVEVELSESVNEGNFEKTMKKAYKNAEKKGCRATTTDVLLGDFNNSKVVDITDFLAFKANYGSTTALYDIAPATMGTGTYADIYSKCTPDGSVGLLDFLVFGRNYGKAISGATVTAVTLSGATTVTVGNSIDITAKVQYSDGTTKSEVVEWSTSDETVAAQTPNGEWTRVTGVKAGTVTIKASINGKVGELTVNVVTGNQTVQSVEVTGGNGVAIGGTLQLTATSLLATGTTETTETTGATWTSSNTSVATVDATGKVTGVSAGITKIKAVRAGVSHQITVVVAPAVNGVKVHAKGYKTIYAWEGTNSTLAGAWPGTALTTTGESTGWGYYYFDGKDGINVIFIDASGNKTGDLTGVKKGEHWYLDGKWYDYNPEQDFIAPEITATPEQGNQEPSSVDVVITAKDGVDTAPKIYYTVDGTMPTTSSTVFSGKITLTKDTVIKAIAVDATSNVSKVYVLSYKLNQDATAPTVTSTPAAGKYETAQTVKLTVKDNRDTAPTIYYTTDGATPKAELSYMYNGQSINVDKTMAIKVLAVDNAGNKTEETYRYTIGKVVSNDFREETIYFVMTPRFYDGDPSNNVHCWDDTQAKNPDTDPAWRGDFKGLVDKLDYIKALGFSAIWVTPPVKNISGYDYHGYHAVNFSEIDGRYKTKYDTSADEAYQKFIDACHAKGMKVIQDIVFNHTGNFGEENLYPLFKRNQTTGLNEDIKTAITKIAPEGLLPANYDSLLPNPQFAARIAAMRAPLDTKEIYHNWDFKGGWEQYEVQIGSIAGDCQDLNTENPIVTEYLRNAYYKYIDMGVDSFRIDTVKHISRLTLNKELIPQLKARGGDNFYMFGEVCSLYSSVWNSGIPAISPCFYTWKESKEYPWGNKETNAASAKQNYADNSTTSGQPTSNNAYLNGNEYHTPDWSKRSNLDVIDFTMHHMFESLQGAFAVARDNDKVYNDATWNVTYVDSHDYGPNGGGLKQRYTGTQAEWAERLNLIFSFRGIPCIYYGSEVEFMKKAPIDVGPNAPLSTTGRAYFGDYLEGTVTATDFGKYTATGKVAETLNYPLAKHIQKLNMMRREIPALQKGQYSVEGVSGDVAYKRRFTDKTQGIDSFVCVTLGSSATFTGIPNGKYVDAVTGAVVNVSGGTLKADCSGQGNMRIYVLNGTGKIGEVGTYLK